MKGKRVGTKAMLGRFSLAVPVSILLAFLLLPLVSVFISQSPQQLISNLATPVAYQALLLSLKTTLVAIVLILVFGTPLSYWLASSSFRGKRILEVAVQMPIVAPPAVAGVGLFLIFGNAGLLGGALSGFGVTIPFSAVAVVMAQTFISGPFYVVTARQSFEAVDEELPAVSRTLGVRPWGTFWRIVVPLALPGMLSGAGR